MAAISVPRPPPSHATTKAHFLASPRRDDVHWLRAALPCTDCTRSAAAAPVAAHARGQARRAQSVTPGSSKRGSIPPRGAARAMLENTPVLEAAKATLAEALAAELEAEAAAAEE